MAMDGAHVVIPPRAAERKDQTSHADRDPFAAVMSFGSQAVRTGLAVGFAIGTITHGAFGGRALAAPIEMRHWAEQAMGIVHDHLWATYEVEVAKTETRPEPPKPEEEKPEEKPAEQAPMAAVPQQPAEPPPPAAQAGKVLTANPDPGETVDMTGNAFVQGEGDQYVGGTTAAAGTGSAATYNPSATTGPTATGTGTGTAPPAPKPQGPDQSRSPVVPSASSWASCPFPPEADQDQVDYAVAVIVVTVRADGSAQSVRVSSDPGHGFGRAARMCALGLRFGPAFDRDGNPTVGTTPPINVTFTR